VSEVAQGTGVAVSTATRMLQGLARMGLVEVEPAGGDRRRRNTRLTDEGRRILEASLALRDARFTALIAPLSDRDRAALVDGVRALTRALSLAREADVPSRVAHPGK
jgi:DNA-binding MarR family transcriptional regulator